MYVIHEIRSVFSFEKGLLFTIRELLIRPGKCVQDFLLEDRNRLVKPIVFLIVTSLIYTVVNRLFQFEDGYVTYSDSMETATAFIFNWIRNNYGYANIIMAFFIGAWIRLFFRKQDVNIFEILVLLCYVFGIGMLIFAIFGVIQSLTNVAAMQMAGVVGLVYMTWSIGQFYGKGNVFHYVKALFAYILGMLTFSLTAVLIGTMIDWIL
jgi:hypothetical protein